MRPPAPQDNSAPDRPTQASAAAVLAFVQAGVTALPTADLLVAAALADSHRAGMSTLALFAVQAIGICFLIAGGVEILRGRDRGLLVVGCVLQLALCFFHAVFWPMTGTTPWGTYLAAWPFSTAPLATGFAMLPIMGILLCFDRQTTEFLRSRKALSPGE
jgi:hypothetical protein